MRPAISRPTARAGRPSSPAPPDVLERVGVRDAQVALAVLAERGAREHRHAGLVEQPVGQLARVEARPLDVREGVERAVRHDAGHARQPVQAVDDELAPLRNSAIIAFDVVARPLERGHAGQLRGGGGARDRVDDQARDRLDQRLRQRRVAEPPAGHRERLREAVEQDRALEQALVRGDRVVLALVEHLGVDLVGEDRAVVVGEQLGHLLVDLARHEPPVGLAGELRITSLVFGVSRSARSSASNVKSRSSMIGSGTGVAPASGSWTRRSGSRGSGR